MGGSRTDRLEGEDGEDCDYGEGECAEVADGGCQGLGYGQLEVGGEGGDAMGSVEEGSWRAGR